MHKLLVVYSTPVTGADPGFFEGGVSVETLVTY